MWATETCALMDYLGLAVTLANHGHPEYWGDVERVVRNQLIENQARNLTWLKDGSGRPDTAQFTWRDIAGRMEGGWAGWSSPTHFLAACETLGHHWGGPELHDKTRAFQNCCGGSGMHALFIAWKNAARFENGTLSVNLHIDKLLPQAEIRGYQPFKGLLTIQLREACTVRVRVPDFVEPKDLMVEVNGAKVAAKTLWELPRAGAARPGGFFAHCLSAPTGDRGSGNRQSGLPALSLSGDVEGRYGACAWSPSARNTPRVIPNTTKSKCGSSTEKMDPGPLYQREDFVKESRAGVVAPAHG